MDDQISLLNIHSEVYLIVAPPIFGKLSVHRPTKPTNPLSAPEIYKKRKPTFLLQYFKRWKKTRACHISTSIPGLLSPSDIGTDIRPWR